MKEKNGANGERIVRSMGELQRVFNNPRRSI